MNPENIVSIKEIAERAGDLIRGEPYTADTVHKWRARAAETDRPFPDPVTTLSVGGIWNWVHVREWLKATGKVKG